MALWGFLAFYVLCTVLTFVFYTRRGGLLHAVERAAAAPATQAAPAE
jgi:NNP family nitrate/nitrite transporter-like MFS transporter